MKSKIIIAASSILCATLVIVAGLNFLSLNKAVKADAATSVSLIGWAYGSTGPNEGIGWISFNCSNTNSCATPPGNGFADYGVKMDLTTGALSGYAWANPRDFVAGTDNIGYISFNAADTVGCPSAPCAPVVNQSSGLVTGFARACGVFQSGCSGALRSTNARGDWDGWISLRGTAQNGSPYGVQMTGRTFNGFAWGAENVGAIDFNPSNCGSCGVAIESFRYTVNASVPSIQPGETTPMVILITATAGIPQDVQLKNITFPGGIAGTYTTSGANHCVPNAASGCNITALLSGLNTPGTYIIHVITGSAGLADIDTPVTIVVDNPSPKVDLVANGTQGPLTVNSGQRVNLTWKQTLPMGGGGNPVQVGSCVIKSGSNVLASNPPSPFATHPITRTETFTIECTYTNTYGSQRSTASDSVTINSKPQTIEEF